MGKIPIDINNNDTLQNILSKTNSLYLTNGLGDLKKIKSGSIDFIFSQAVLEHIRLNEFNETIKQLYRVLKIDGTSSHQIDLRDHLSENLNNLRFSKKFGSRFLC